MEVIVQKACGLDVHQASITACIIRQGLKKQIKTFGTTTKELEELKKWLHRHKITDVAMESTGIYWKPVFNILGNDFIVLLVNARHIKNVPGRKTDVEDAQWICKLLRAGLLQGSYIPEEKIRQLRDLTRYQKKLQNQIQSEKNRVHKILQDANIKLTSVLSDIFGKTGKSILNDLGKGITDEEKLSEYFNAKGLGLIHSAQQARAALKGRFCAHHQIMLNSMLGHIDYLQNQIEELEKQVQTIIKEKYGQEYELLQTIPGVKLKAAAAIIAELGVDMDHFASHKHLSAWAGLCPGQKESAGKKKE